MKYSIDEMRALAGRFLDEHNVEGDPLYITRLALFGQWLLQQKLQQTPVSRSADIEEPKMVVYNAETERVAKEQWTNCRKIDAVKTVMQMGYSLKDAKTFCERHFG